MKAIINWFKNPADYYQGVAIYASLPTKSTRLLKQLNRGKSRKNMSDLAVALRQYKNQAKKAPQKIAVPTTPAPTKTPDVSIELTKNLIKTESSRQEFKGVMIGDLPPQLRTQYSKAYNLFIQLIELKFELNDLPASKVKEALAIQLKIATIDAERDVIWNSIRHWQKHKTILPQSVTDFSDLSPLQVFKKHKSIKTSVSKINSRVDLLYEKLAEAKTKSYQIKLERKINNSEKRLHVHRENLIKLEKLL